MVPSPLLKIRQISYEASLRVLSDLHRVESSSDDDGASQVDSTGSTKCVI